MSVAMLKRKIVARQKSGKNAGEQELAGESTTAR